jgi:hypothetical protein
MTSFMKTLCRLKFDVVYWKKCIRVITKEIEDERPDTVFSYTAYVHDLNEAFYHRWNVEQRYFTLKLRHQEVCEQCTARMVHYGAQHQDLVRKETTTAVLLDWTITGLRRPFKSRDFPTFTVAVLQSENE